MGGDWRGGTGFSFIAIDVTVEVSVGGTDGSGTCVAKVAVSRARRVEPDGPNGDTMAML